MIIKRAVKGIIIGIALFYIMTMAGALMIRFTPMPESWGFWYVIAMMIIVVFLCSLYISTAAQSKGLLIGIITGCIEILIIFLSVSLIFCKTIDFTSIISFWYALPLISGALGGIIGVNSKK